jgi:hypothetical protein
VVVSSTGLLRLFWHNSYRLIWTLIGLGMVGFTIMTIRDAFVALLEYLFPMDSSHLVLGKFLLATGSVALTVIFLLLYSLTIQQRKLAAGTHGAAPVSSSSGRSAPATVAAADKSGSRHGQGQDRDRDRNQRQGRADAPGHPGPPGRLDRLGMSAEPEDRPGDRSDDLGVSDGSEESAGHAVRPVELARSARSAGSVGSAKFFGHERSGATGTLGWPAAHEEYTAPRRQASLAGPVGGPSSAQTPKGQKGQKVQKAGPATGPSFGLAHAKRLVDAPDDFV